MKKIFIVVPVLLLLVGLGYILMKSPTPQSTQVSDSQSAISGIPLTPTTQADQAGKVALSGSISLAEITKHAVEGDCWTAIDGSVYDLSSFTSKHPGGPVILSVCGKDGSELFHGQHGEREKRRVESMIIGSLAK